MQRPRTPSRGCGAWYSRSRRSERRRHPRSSSGTGRAATRSYYAHHLAEVSTAVQVADAVAIGNAAAHIIFKLKKRYRFKLHFGIMILYFL